MDIRDKALQLIKIRPHLSGELARKLKLKGFNSDEISRLITDLTDQGLINDPKFATSFVESMVRYKTYGFYMMLMKLMQHGMGKSEAETMLRELVPVEVEVEIANRVVARERNSDKVKLAQKLQRKGFRTNVIAQVIRSSPRDV